MVSMSSFTPVAPSFPHRIRTIRPAPSPRRAGVACRDRRATPQFTAPLLMPAELAALLELRSGRRRGTGGARRAVAPRRSAGPRRLRRRPHARAPCSSTSTPSSRRRRAPAAGTRCPTRPRCRRCCAGPGCRSDHRGGRLRRRQRCCRRPGLVAAALGGPARRPGRGARRRLPGVGRRRAAGHRRAPRGPRRATSSCAPAAMPVLDADGAAAAGPRTACCSTRGPRRATGARPSRSTRWPGTSRARATARHRAPRPGRALAAPTRSPGAAPERFAARRRRRCHAGRRLLRLRGQRRRVVLAAGARRAALARRPARAVPGFLVAVVRRPEPARRDRCRAVSGRSTGPGSPRIA